jgi:glycosyltransferase involved in cell wall biosynthesis
MIVYVSDSINSKKNGGSSTSGYEFLQLLRIHYSSVVLVTADYITESELNAEFYGSKMNSLFDLKIIKRKVPILNFTLRSIFRPLYYFFQDLLKSSFVDLNNYYIEGDLNILYINSWSSMYSPKFLKNLNKFTKVCIVRGSPESFVFQSFEVDKQKVILNAANYLEDFNYLIYVSSNGLTDWGKLINKNIKSYYLPNSINEYDINKVKNIPQKIAARNLGFDSSYFNIVIVGSVQKRKAQDILLKVVEDFLLIKPNIKFHIVGVISKLWGGDEIYNEIIKSSYSDKFIFHGHSNDVAMYMQAADLLIFTSHAEAFPRTVAEYMSLGKPILAADVSGVNEMIKDGSNGYLYNPSDPKSLVTAFSKMESSEDDKCRLSKCAYDTYWEKFSKKVHISKALEVFKKITNEH